LTSPRSHPTSIASIASIARDSANRGQQCGADQKYFEFIHGMIRDKLPAASASARKTNLRGLIHKKEPDPTGMSDSA
jgi:hypothetical protein